MYKIVIKNTVTNQEYVYDNIEDINGGKKLYYNFNIDTSNLDDGEYKLTLFKGDDIVCTELLKVGDFNSDKIQYSKGANVFIDAKPTKIDVAATGIKLSHSTFSEIPDIFDFSNVTDTSCMFYSCKNLTTIPLLDTSNATDMNYMFGSCNKLQSIPQFDTAKVVNMDYMFVSCSSLQSIPQLDCGNVTSMNTFFGYIPLNKLTNIGGFKDLKISVTSYFLDKAPNLTVDSLMNVINNLYDLTANGLSGKSMKFGQTNLDKLTPEQIAVATAKGWTLTA